MSIRSPGRSPGRNGSRGPLIRPSVPPELPASAGHEGTIKQAAWLVLYWSRPRSLTVKEVTAAIWRSEDVFIRTAPGLYTVEYERAIIKVVVLGSGSFGTAIGTVLARNGHEVVLLTRSELVVESVNKQHHNCFYMQEFELPHNLTATQDARLAFRNASLIVHSIPIQATPAYLAERAHFIAPDVPIVSLSKGIHTDTLQFMKDIIPQALGRRQPTAFLSGPNFAREILEGQISAGVVAADTPELAARVQELFQSPLFRVYTSTDVVGVEIGGALKNVLAIAAGVCEGLGYGQNTKAMLITRGLAELNTFARALGADPGTLAGLSGVGDVMLTCMGTLSRNMTVGLRLGRGETLAQIGATMKEVAEGVPTAPAAVRLADKLGLDAPICRCVAAVLGGESSPLEAVRTLMAITPTRERF